MSDRPRLQRKSIRLQDYDYAQPGAYFVTICSYNRLDLLGSFHQGILDLSEMGEIAAQVWQDIPAHCSGATLDTWVIMPDHLHGIVLLGTVAETPTSPGSSMQDDDGRVMDPPLQNKQTKLLDIVQFFKSASGRLINKQRGTKGVPVWQRGYYEHVIRNDTDLRARQEYIMHNPVRWLEKQGNL